MLRLDVAAARWRAHLNSLDVPKLVPVVKGNGYGFGRDRLYREAEFLTSRVVAVGTYPEIPADPHGDVLVLTPWQPLWRPPVDDRVIHTVSRLADLRDIPAGSRAVVEIRTSMCRHGIPVADLEQGADDLTRIVFEGWSIHLPLTGDVLAEAIGLIGVAREVADGTAWVSHLKLDDLPQIGGDVRLRSGTALWLGDRSALHPRAAVLDVHPVRRGERVGYRQRRVPGDGHIVVAGGGTAHGVGLAAPSSAASVAQRVKTVGRGGLEAAGAALSPYRIAGKQRWFVEPPHMQCSLLFLPDKVEPPAVGDDLDVDVRFTSTTFDRVDLD